MSGALIALKIESSAFTYAGSRIAGAWGKEAKGDSLSFSGLRLSARHATQDGGLPLSATQGKIATGYNTYVYDARRIRRTPSLPSSG